MSAQKLKLTYGLRISTPEDKARDTLFPHAEEPYHTGSCLPYPQQFGKVYVCKQCTEARTAWLSTSNPAQNEADKKAVALIFLVK